MTKSKFPKELYAKWDQSGQEDFLVTDERPQVLVSVEDGKVTLARYELVGEIKAEALVSLKPLKTR